MGRYYSGDINGKFMFAVQPSDAGERFGATEQESYFIEYSVNREQYDKILKTGSVDKVNKMFDDHNSYNDETMKEYNVSDKDLKQYADYRLGLKMKEWFDKHTDLDTLYYSAEL
mgnify:FL=1